MKKCIFCKKTYDDSQGMCTSCKKVLLPIDEADELIEKEKINESFWFFMLTMMVIVMIVVGGAVGTGHFGLAVLMIAAFIFSVLAASRTDKKEKAEKNKLIQTYYEKYRGEKFYSDCLKQGIESLSSDKNKAKAKLIFENLHKQDTTPFTGSMESEFEFGKSVYDDTLKKKENEKISQERQTEKEVWTKLTKYSKFYGNEKRVKMMTDEYERCQKAVDAADKKFRDSRA